MKKLLCTIATTLLLTLPQITTFGAILIPNTNILTEEIITTSTPQSKMRTANVEGSWKQDDIGWWWEYPDGSYAQNTWLCIDNYWYYFNADGYMYVGWRYINNNWYYLNPGDISNLPFGAMATGWHSIYSANYEKNFDYYLGPDGNLIDSPSERFVSYGHDFTLDGDSEEIDTTSRAEEIADILESLYGITGNVRLNKVASDVLNTDSSVPNGKTHLNTGLFVHNGHGGPGCAVFRSYTTLTGQLTGTDQNGYNGIKIAGNSMNNCKIALFFSCSTGLVGTEENGNPGKGDVLTTCQDAGALGAFGFTNAVLHVSDNVFGPALVRELGAGATLTEAALVAQETVPLYDACRNYRIVGGDTRFIITDEEYELTTNSDISLDETYMLYSSSNDYDTYVKLIDGVMTSDYYTADKLGNIVSSKNKIPANSVNSIMETLNQDNQINTYTSNKRTKDYFDVFENIDGETKLLRISFSEVIVDGICELEAEVIDLQTGNEIPYSKILENY